MISDFPQRSSQSGRTRRSRKAVAFCLLAACAFGIQGCVAPKKKKPEPVAPKHVNTKTKFSSKDFGVKGSPRITMTKRPRKGGGRYQIGKPYMIAGKRYYPKDDPNLDQVGMASWYGPNFHGRLTANGEIYDQFSLSAAHPTMPLPSYAKVTNLKNGRSVTVRVNDRGPYAHGRVIDLSSRAADLLDYKHAGVAKVRVEYVGKARMDGLDEELLLASYNDPAGRSLPGLPGSQNTMIASADTGEGSMLGITGMSSGSKSIGATGAIETVAPTTTGSVIALVPIPDERPTLFEGVPLDVSSNSAKTASWPEEEIYRVVNRPLAFAPDQAPDLSAYLKRYAGKTPYLGQHEGRSAVIVLGNFVSGTSRLELAAIFEAAGTLQFDEHSGLATLETVEEHANAVLDFARSQGLRNARIR